MAQKDKGKQRVGLRNIGKRDGRHLPHGEQVKQVRETQTIKNKDSSTL